MWGWAKRIASRLKREPKSPKEIIASASDEQLVEGLFMPGLREQEMTLIVFVGGEITDRGPRMGPLLNAALRDPRCFEQGDLPQPAQYILWYLTDFENFESAPFVADHAEKCDDGTRSYLIKYLASSGDRRIIPTLHFLVCDDPEEEEDDDCYDGLVAARDSGRAPKEFLDRFDHILRRGDYLKKRLQEEREGDPRHELLNELGIERNSELIPHWPDFEELESMPPARRTACLVASLHSAVASDGFHFYFQSYGYLAQGVVDALETVGATQTADLLGRCLKIVGESGITEDFEVRHEAIRQIAIHTPDEIWHSYESDLFSRSKSDEALLLRYVLEHRDQFEKQSD